MRRFIAVFVATIAGLVVLLSFKTAPTKTPPAAALSSATPGSPAASSASAVASPAESSAAVASSVPVRTPSASATAATTPSATTVAKPSATKTVTGASVVVSDGRREYGVITVQLTVVNGKITTATASEPTTDERSREIASFSIPTLDREAVSKQSAQIDAVSGATITSGAYAQSLQSAIDKAKV